MMLSLIVSYSMLKKRNDKLVNNYDGELVLSFLIIHTLLQLIATKRNMIMTLLNTKYYPLVESVLYSS